VSAAFDNPRSGATRHTDWQTNASDFFWPQRNFKRSFGERVIGDARWHRVAIATMLKNARPIGDLLPLIRLIAESVAAELLASASGTTQRRHSENSDDFCSDLRPILDRQAIRDIDR
jgi:hypothetical protein